MDKRVSILAGAAVLAIVLAFWLATQRAPEREGSLLAGPVLAGLGEKINDVTGVHFVGAGDRPIVTLTKSGEVWTVAERDGYPANAGKVRTALLNLVHSEVLETKTANPERYAQIGVEDLAAEDAQGVRVELSGNGVDMGLIIGNYAGQQGQGTYVRRPGEAQSLMAAGNLVPDREVGPWLRRELSDIASSRIREVELSKAGRRTLRVFKDNSGDANFKVADVPRGREVQSDYVANGLASTLSGLALEDVARDETGTTPEGVTLHTAVYRMFDGVVVTIEGWREGGESTDETGGMAWIRLAAALDEDVARARIADDVAQEQAAAQAEVEAARAQAAEGEQAAPAAAPVIDVEARTAERLAELNNEVTEISERVAGWRFQVPAYKFTNLDKSIDDMLKSAGG
jgi:hypothetical protein